MHDATTIAAVRLPSPITVRALHHLIDNGGRDDLRMFPPGALETLLDGGWATRDEAGIYALTVRGRLDAGRPDTIADGELTVLCNPAGRAVFLRAGAVDLVGFHLPHSARPWLDEWRAMTGEALRVVGWEVTQPWQPVDETPGTTWQWRAPVRHNPHLATAVPLPVGLHIGLASSGREHEVSCPCPKAACGLVVARDATCSTHGATRTPRQIHSADRCPALS